MIAQVKSKYYTPEEYLELEKTAQIKHEYLNGEIIEMAGGTINHNQIAGNFYRAFPWAIQSYNHSGIKKYHLITSTSAWFSFAAYYISLK